jgi:DNA-binding response OmpR family regulator
LLVHAETDDRAMYAEYLEANGYSVIEAPTTDAAQPMLERVDAVITGLLVPGDTPATEMIGRIRRRWTAVEKPVVVVTGCVVQDVLDEARGNGCDALLVKPCLPDALLAELRRVLTAN